MRLIEHIGKITWSIADKFLFVAFGIVTIIQFRYMQPTEMGLFVLLFSVFNWIFILSDSFSLQNLIQFGFKQDRNKVNLISLTLHISVTLGLSILIYLLRSPLAVLFDEPRIVDALAYLPLLTLLNIPRTFAIKIFYRDANMNFLFISNAIYFGLMTILTFYFIATHEEILFVNIVNIFIYGTAISAVASLYLIRKELKFGKSGDVTISRITKFSTPYMLSSSLHLAPRQLDTYIIQFFFNTEVVGIYFLAKNLFRVFEEIVNAANGLIYPAAVRQITKKDFTSLNDMMTKSISLILFFNLFAIVLLNLGLTHFIVTSFLPEQYYLAIEQFNILAIVSLGLPSTILGGILVADGKPKLVLNMIFISLILWVISFIAIGYIAEPNLIAIPHLIYFAVLSIMLFVYTNQDYGFKFVQLFRAIPDSINFLTSLLMNKNQRK